MRAPSGHCSALRVALSVGANPCLAPLTTKATKANRPGCLPLQPGGGGGQGPRCCSFTAAVAPRPDKRAQAALKPQVRKRLPRPRVCPSVGSAQRAVRCLAWAG